MQEVVGRRAREEEEVDGGFWEGVFDEHGVLRHAQDLAGEALRVVDVLDQGAAPDAADHLGGFAGHGLGGLGDGGFGFGAHQLGEGVAFCGGLGRGGLDCVRSGRWLLGWFRWGFWHWNRLIRFGGRQRRLGVVVHVFGRIGHVESLKRDVRPACK